MKNQDLIDDIISGLAQGHKDGSHKWVVYDAMFSSKYKYSYKLEVDLDDSGKSSGDFIMSIDLDDDFNIELIKLIINFKHLNEIIQVNGYTSFGGPGSIDNDVVYNLGLEIFENQVKNQLPTKNEEREALQLILNKVGKAQMRDRKIDELLDEPENENISDEDERICENVLRESGEKDRGSSGENKSNKGWISTVIGKIF